MSRRVIQHALVPKLRFPEFRDATSWTVKALGELTNTITERVGDSDCVPFTVATGEGLVSQEEKYGRTIAGKSLRNYYRLQRNDFAFNKSATKLFPQGYIGRFQGDERAAVPNSIFTCFRIADESIDAAFLDYLFQGNLHGRWLRNYIAVGARAHGALNISNDDLYAMPVSLPEGEQSLAEQRKIADCLGSLDDLIAAEGRKLDALRAHKKGLMQGLFPREGERQPRLRFPEFQDAGEWEEKAISGLGEVITGSTPSTTRSEYYGGDRQFVSPADISELRFIRATKTTLTELGFQQTRPIKARSVLFVCIGSTIGKVAQNLKVCATNQQINSVIASPGTSAGFLYYLLSECAERIAEIAGNQAVPIINKSLFSRFKVLCPKEDEQQRIADCFSALDVRITAQAEKLDSLHTHKRGLMQQLFPSTEVS